MADNNLATGNLSGSSGHFKEAVCIEAGRIFDSCSDKDCLEDLQVFFTAEGQSVIDSATLIKCKFAEVMDVYLAVEPVPFNKGFFAVDITFYFRLQFSTYVSPVASPVSVTGLAYHCKKVILFGSEGGVRTFRSDRSGTDTLAGTQLPVATIKCVNPICLGCRIVESSLPYAEPLGVVPGDVADCFDGELVVQPAGSKAALVTLGVFTIVTLERDVQMMIPAYDYCIPEKDCVNSITPEDPCEMFKRIKFPVNEFFPENLNETSCAE